MDIRRRLNRFIRSRARVPSAREPITDHHFHPSHTLVHTTSEDFACDSCHRHFVQGSPAYACNSCDFFMDEECALMGQINFSLDRDVSRHLTHQHPMTLLNDNQAATTIKKCFACGEACSSGTPTYGCERCAYFLHKSCLTVPSKLDHPLHSSHNLSLRVNHGNLRCKLCKKRADGFGFECNKCALWFCFVCSQIKSRAVKSDHHEHLLYLDEKLSTEKLGWCSGYETYCKQRALFGSEEFSRTCSSVLRCTECDFVVHLLCGPLPSVIKHECHVDPLTLVDSVFEDESDGFYCDVCETERDPRLCVYRCQDCKFTAHAHCVVSEIAKVLKGDLGDVELKSVGDDIWKSPEKMFQSDELALVKQDKSVMTLMDIINKLTKDETNKLRYYYKYDELALVKQGIAVSLQGHSTINQVDFVDKDIERTLKFTRLADKDFIEFISELEKWHDKNKLELKSRDLALAIVEVEGYMIPLTLARVLRALLYKYGDFSDTALKSSREWKSLMYFLVCKVVKQMCSTKVVDITRDALQEWYLHLRFLNHSGEFKISFARAHFDVLVRAYLGAQANRLDDDIPKRIRQKIEDLHKELAKKNAELEKITNEYHGSSPKSDFMKECEKHASELKWKNACEDLLSHPNETKNQGFDHWRSL